MSPICWARIDDRLIHGQVTVGWRQHLRYEQIDVVDDQVRADPFLDQALRLAAPGGVTVHVYTVAEAIDALSEPGRDRILVLFRSPQAALALVEGGVPLAHLNVGNIAPTADSVRVFRSTSLNAAHVAALDALWARGVEIAFQLSPDDAQAGWPAIRRRYSSSRGKGRPTRA